MSTLTGTGRLIRFVLRRDRLRLVLWTAAVVGLVVVSAASLPPLYPDQASIDSYVRLFGDNPALIAFAGPGYGFDDPNLGVILVNEVELFAIVGVALMSIFLVNRQTRAEEESERAELLRSNVVGRHAPTAAGVAVIGMLNVVVGALCAIGFIALDYPVLGSVALASSITAAGLVFAAITALAAQVVSSGRATLGLASGVLALAFVLRAVGDIGGNALRWASPIGWSQGVRAFAGEQWWALGLSLAVAAAGTAVAFALSDRRDLGSGLVPHRPGSPTAGRWATRPLGLAWVLQRGALVGWIVALFLLGFVYGSIGDDVDDLVADSPEIAEVLVQLEGVDLTDAFFSSAMTMLALISAGFAISAALRLRGEERAGRVEAVLATPTSRWSWAASHLAVAVVGTVLVMAAAGLGTGLGYAAAAGHADDLGRLVWAGLVTVPAILVLVGVAVALFGLVPRLAYAAWAALAVAAVVGFLGQLLRLPAWSRQVSPFEHLPGVPAEPTAVAPLVVLTAVAAGLVVLGLWGFGGRDLDTE
jgi:ABC-2 type transport system permease protein